MVRMQNFLIINYCVLIMGNKQKREMLDGAEQNKYKEEQKEAFREMFNKMRNACKLRKKKDIEPPKMTTTTETKKENNRK